MTQAPSSLNGRKVMINPAREIAAHTQQIVAKSYSYLLSVAAANAYLVGIVFRNNDIARITAMYIGGALLAISGIYMIVSSNKYQKKLRSIRSNGVWGDI